MYVPIDITDQNSITNAAAIVKEKFGKVDVLVNNAVFFNREDQSPLKISFDLLHSYINTNFIGHVFVTQAFLPLIKESTGGRIVNMSTSISSMTTMGDSVNTNPRIAKATPLGYSSRV